MLDMPQNLLKRSKFAASGSSSRQSQKDYLICCTASSLCCAVYPLSHKLGIQAILRMKGVKKAVLKILEWMPEFLLKDISIFSLSVFLKKKTKLRYKLAFQSALLSMGKIAHNKNVLLLLKIFHRSCWYYVTQLFWYSWHACGQSMRFGLLIRCKKGCCCVRCCQDWWLEIKFLAAWVFGTSSMWHVQRDESGRVHLNFGKMTMNEVMVLLGAAAWAWRESDRASASSSN